MLDENALLTSPPNRDQTGFPSTEAMPSDSKCMAAGARTLGGRPFGAGTSIKSISTSPGLLFLRVLATLAYVGGGGREARSASER